MKDFFTTADPLEKIIASVLSPEKVLKTRHIVSGWTNIVIEVETEKTSYFFRFPRNPFWSKMIIKDAKFCNFIEGKTSFYTPSMKLLYDNSRPFSVHEKIKGYCLTDRIYNLSHTALAAASYDIAKFISELNQIDAASAPPDVKYPLSDFLKELDAHHYETHLTSDHRYLKKTEDKNCLVHGDLNLGNVLVDDSGKVVAVIDFCFAGTGHPGMDLSRIISRPTPGSFEEDIIKNYNSLSKRKIPSSRVLKMRDVWARIDQGMIGYLKRTSPEIVLPPGI